MSGGHFEYEDRKLEDWAEQIQHDMARSDDFYVGRLTQEQKAKFLLLAEEMQGLRQVLHDYDWWMSGDSGIERATESLDKFFTRPIKLSFTTVEAKMEPRQPEEQPPPPPEEKEEVPAPPPSQEESHRIQEINAPQLALLNHVQERGFELPHFKCALATFGGFTCPVHRKNLTTGKVSSKISYQLEVPGYALAYQGKGHRQASFYFFEEGGDVNYPYWSYIPNEPDGSPIRCLRTRETRDSPPILLDLLHENDLPQ